VLERTVFLIHLSGDVASDPPGVEVCQAVFKGCETVDSIDMQLFAASVLRARALEPLEKEFAAALLTELSLWDPETCTALAQRPATELIRALSDPRPALVEIARARGWDGRSLQEVWNRGIEGTFGGRCLRHSAFLAVSGDINALEHRVWRAQLRVLFPLMEEKRLKLVEQLRPWLRVPFKTTFGIVIDAVEDLELGHIDYQLRKLVPEANRNAAALIAELKSIRHALAHLEPYTDWRVLTRLLRARF
jgi:hypothetical protein